MHPKYTWSRNDFGSPRSTNFINFFHIGLRFCFFPAISIPSACTDRNRPCFQCTNRHSQFGTFAEPGPNRILFFQIVFPTLITQVADQTDFVQEEQLGLRCWTKISATCVVVDVIQMSGHSELGSFNNVEASAIINWVQTETASAAWSCGTSRHL